MWVSLLAATSFRILKNLMVHLELFFGSCKSARLQTFDKVREDEKGWGEWFQVNFKFEKLSMFSFIYGLNGHGELFCKR